MLNTHNFTKRLSLLCFLSIFSLSIHAQPNPTDLIVKLEKAVGGWDKLWEQNDVQFDYLYHYPGPDKKDVSQERYIFEGEHSWAKYSTHQINVMPDKEGEVVQSLVNNKATCVMDGKVMDDPEIVGSTEFLRRANYFWFTMNFKMNNPGTVHEYLGTETVNDIEYNKVKVSYKSENTGKEQNDGYILYLNPNTNLVDQFFFSLPAFGVNDIVIKMEVKYEEINGLKLPTRRLIYMPGEDGKLSAEATLVQTTTNVKFNNGFKPDDLKG